MSKSKSSNVLLTIVCVMQSAYMHKRDVIFKLQSANIPRLWEHKMATYEKSAKYTSSTQWHDGSIQWCQRRIKACSTCL